MNVYFTTSRNYKKLEKKYTKICNNGDCIINKKNKKIYVVGDYSHVGSSRKCLETISMRVKQYEKNIFRQLTYEQCIKNINNIIIPLLRYNSNIHFSEEQFKTLELLQEIM